MGLGSCSLFAEVAMRTRERHPRIAPSEYALNKQRFGPAGLLTRGYGRHLKETIHGAVGDHTNSPDPQDVGILTPICINLSRWSTGGLREPHAEVGRCVQTNRHYKSASTARRTLPVTSTDHLKLYTRNPTFYFETLVLSTSPRFLPQPALSPSFVSAEANTEEPVSCFDLPSINRRISLSPGSSL